MTGTKRLRLIARVREIEDQLARLTPDLEDEEMRVFAREARNLVHAIREELEE